MSVKIVAEWVSVDTKYGITGSCSTLRVVKEDDEAFTVEDPKIGYVSRIKVYKKPCNEECILDKLNLIKNKTMYSTAITATRYKIADDNYDKKEFYRLVQDNLDMDKAFSKFNVLEIAEK